MKADEEDGEAWRSGNKNIREKTQKAQQYSPSLVLQLARIISQKFSATQGSTTLEERTTS